MVSKFLTCVCVACAAVLWTAWAIIVLRRKGINPIDEILRRYRQQPWYVQFLLLAVVAQLIVYGSTKMPTNDVPGEGSAPTNAAPMRLRAPLGQRGSNLAQASGFTPDEIAAGYALWRVGTNECWNFNTMPGAQVVETWRQRGAAADWTVCDSTVLGPVVLDTQGRVATTNGVFSAYEGLLAIVPETNWPLLGTNAPSRVWWTDTPWASAVFTWQNALLGRETNTPVSVQIEFSRDGDYISRYDLSSTGTNLTSELFYRLRPEDVDSDDRDGDGLSTHDEVSVYHTDPGLVDTDGDGLLDAEEIWVYQTDPTTRSVPNEQIVARITGSATNELYRQASSWGPESPLTSLKLWDGFAADWPQGMTNLVYERTLRLGTSNGWQHYFLSSKATEAGDWDLRGLVLEWDDGCGDRGTAMISPYGDSLPLPVTNATVTIRLKAIGPKVRCPKPMYLIGYAPTVTISGGTTVRDADGVARAYSVPAGGAVGGLQVTIDRSQRPCKAAIGAAELALPGLSDLASLSDGAISYEGDENGGVITVARPGCCQLPAFRIDDPVSPEPRPRLMARSRNASGDDEGQWIICLDPSIDYSGEHKYVTTGLRYDPENGDYSVERYYPLDSKCLWRNWQMSVDGYWNCSCEPTVTAGAGADELPFVETSYELRNGGAEAVGIVKAFGQELWRGTAAHAWRDVGQGGGVTCGSDLLSRGDDCDDCEGGCENGNCDAESGSGLNSVKFRVSLGVPRRGQHSGFVFFESEDPVAIAMDLMTVSARDDAAVTVTTEGADRIVACDDLHGRRVRMSPMSDGVRLTVTDSATDRLEDVWEVTNAGGDTNVVRIVQISRLNNVMSDVTFACDTDGIWSKTDNISGLVETLVRVDRLNDPADGKLYETRTICDADGHQLDRVSTESSRIGSFGNAVLRETRWEQDTGSQVRWRAATYWNDAAHKDRHGQLKLMTGNCTAWEYHDYDSRGFETLRVEQRNGSPVPTSFPEVVAGDLYWTTGLADAFVTVYDYTPFAGDDNSPDDVDRVRCETRYVVKDGRATCIARTWTRLTHVLSGAFDAVKTETWRAASATATRENPANAYAYEIAYDERDVHASLIQRGAVVEELDEDGVLSENTIEERGGIMRTTTRKSHRAVGDDEAAFLAEATYEVVEQDAVFGHVLRRATCLTEGDVVVDEEVSTYDEKGRLRSTTYLDGTSETNAWSCCRKLWSRDREGRKTLRSAVTGHDRLYYAEEEVWLRELSTNGEHKVTQHFLDGLGRETNTVVYVASAAGEATCATASEGQARSLSTVSYPYGGDDHAVSVDARGKTTVRSRQAYEDREESVVGVYAAEAMSASVQTLTTQYRGGRRVTEKTWDDKWTRETEFCDYDAAGCEIRRTVTESSDCGTVTNRITHCDFLGRTVLEMTPLGNTATTYHGASSRADATTFTAGDVTRITTTLYGDRGEPVGSVKDGVTRRTDESYEMDDDGAWWRVTREEVFSDDDVASRAERREQLTGRATGVISRRIEITASGVVEESVERFGDVEGERVTTVSNAVAGVTLLTSRMGRVIASRTPVRAETHAYDAFGWQVGRMRVVQDGVRVLPCETVDCNALGEVVARRTYTNETAFVTETYGYDSFGRRVRTVDALGNETVTRYDAVGNVVEQSGATTPVRYNYDTAGRRLSLSTTKDGRIWDVTRWTYDPMTGVCTAKRYPDGSQVTYASTSDGLPLVTTLASGRTTTNVYDAKRRQVGSLTSDGAGDATYAYDTFGKMTAASNTVSASAYLSHRGGIVTNETTVVDGMRRAFVRTVDAFGRLAGRGLVDGPAQAIAYDEANRVATLSTGEAVVGYAYGDEGEDLGYTLTLANGMTVTRQVVRDDYSKRIIAVSNFVNGAAVGGFAYDRDVLGRIVRRDAGEDRATTFAYDAVGQVVCENSQAFQSAFAYDQIGNRVGSEALACTTDGGVAMLDGKMLTYDSAMRLTSVATGGVTIATYAYDAFGRRVRKTTPAATRRYFYDGWNLVREEANGETVDYVWGKDIAGSLTGAGGVGGLLYIKRNGTVYVPLYDANGNIVASVDATGAIVAEYAYDAFGNAVSPTADAPMSNDFSFRYSTKYYDEETGFSYYGYRYYAPTAGRWLTRDPLEEQGGLNLHVFCGNDGVNKVDGLGLKAEEPSTDAAAKDFWKGVVVYFRNNLKYEWSANVLEKDLSEIDHNAYWEFAKRPCLADAIRDTPEFKNDLLDVVAQTKSSRVNTTRSLVYGSGDLHLALTPAKVSYRGKVCKSRNGAATWHLRVRVFGTYSYQAWRYADVPVDKQLEAQYSYAVQEFKWESRFEEVRK